MKEFAKTARWLPVCAGIFLMGSFMGCSGGPSPGDTSWTLVPMNDVAIVVGDWDGTVKKERTVIPGTVHLMIRENGTYLFAGQHIAEVAVGSGSLEARDGRLIGETDRRAVTLSLYDHNGKQVIISESINRETGARYHGQFTKVQ